MTLATAFKSDYQRYEGVRPIQVLAMRVGYVLVFSLVGYRSWTGILSHQGAWDPLQAAAVSMWASSSVLSLIGVFHPLKMLPLFFFEIGYKLIWLAVVAWPLWSADRLAGSPAEEMTHAFLAVVLPMALIPWRYAFRTYILGQPKRHLARTVTFG